MEPKPVIELNNAASELQAEEEAEELAVLTGLTQMLVENTAVLYAAVEAVTRIDLATARARHAKCARCVGRQSDAVHFSSLLCSRHLCHGVAQPPDTPARTPDASFLWADCSVVILALFNGQIAMLLSLRLFHSEASHDRPMRSVCESAWKQN